MSLEFHSASTDRQTAIICRVCGDSKQPSAFYAHPFGAHGRNNKCKECAKAYERERRSNPTTRQAILERDRVRTKTVEAKRTRSQSRRKRGTLHPIVTLSAGMNKMLARTLAASGSSKVRRSEAVLGYGCEKLRQRLECQFKPGMGWHNRSSWHIDHKKPIKAFIDSGITDPKTINSLCNLQPMWAEENVIKGSKWPRPANDNLPRDYFDAD